MSNIILRDCFDPDFCTVCHSRARENPLILKRFLDPRMRRDDENVQIETVLLTGCYVAKNTVFFTIRIDQMGLCSLSQKFNI